LRLLHVIHTKPGQFVNALAEAVTQPPAVVSHQLKLLGDFHFVQAAPSGRRVAYHPASARTTNHPFLCGLRGLVARVMRDAGPLRGAKSLRGQEFEAWVGSLVKLFTTYTHLRRLLILRQLVKDGTGTIAGLTERIGLSPAAAYRHLDKLCRRGIVVCDGKEPAHWRLAPGGGDNLRQQLQSLVVCELKADRTPAT
jgi:DNA-binding IclR family transcriptional regulator